jgi:hypothetical protein
MKLNKDLGYTPQGPLQYMKAPHSEVAADAASPETEKEYPHFHYEGDEELPIPDEGTLTVRYKIVWKQEEEAEGKERYCCKVQLREIVSADGGVSAPAKSGSGAADALDKIKELLEGGEEEEEEEGGDL